MEQHQVQRVAGILRANQVAQRHRDFLGRRKAIFAVQNHAVAAIEHQHRSAGALIFALVDLEVLIIQFERRLQAVAANRGEQSRIDVQIHRVAKLIASA